MLKLNVIGEILGTSGYANHVRGLVNAVYEQGLTDLHLQCTQQAGWERMVNPAEHNMITHPYYKDGTTLVVNIPPFWQFNILDNPKHFIGFLVWEGSHIPKYWIEHIINSKIDKIFVPSQHTKNAILNTSKDYYKKQLTEAWMEKRIVIIPHGVNRNIFKPIENHIKPEKFTFFCDKGWRGGMNDRGGVQYLLKAYCEEFTKKDNVQLVLKLNPAYLQKGFNFGNELKNLGVTQNPDSPVIMINQDMLGYAQLNQLYNDAHVFVTTQMADAFNLGGLQAMATGIPTIQTNYGGQLDYMTENNSWFIDSEPVDVTWDIMYEGVQWVRPKMDSIRKALRYAYENQDEVRAKGNQALVDSAKWNWSDTAKKVVEVLKTLK